MWNAINEMCKAYEQNETGNEPKTRTRVRAECNNFATAQALASRSAAQNTHLHARAKKTVGWEAEKIAN